MTDPSRNQRLQEIFDRAYGYAPDDREMFLRHACAGDADLLEAVQTLLEAAENVDTAQVLPPLFDTQADTRVLGQLLGPYRVLKPLGAGGMGSVFLAERSDDVFKKQVAIKVIRDGPATGDLQARFVIERNVLAALDHPYIVRLIDGGQTLDGTPYFVMDYVEGTPIVTYCEQNRVSLRNRLELFRKVCEAVQYAHRHLIVHRDLKPGNILITSEGEPRVLDFGVAKILSPNLLDTTLPLTVTGRLWFTPDYASPEQIRDEPITTATDVYQLGVVLYELISGKRPFALAGRSLSDIQRIICEERPTRLATSVDEPTDSSKKASTAPSHRKLSELDDIVQTALRKEPARRYPSPEQLAYDIERYLNGRPVFARKDTFAYRLSKFVGRNRYTVLAGSLGILSVLAGFLFSVIQYREAGQQRDLAVKAANTMVSELSDHLSHMPGPATTRLHLLESATVVYDEIIREGTAQKEHHRQIAGALVQLSHTYRLLGRTDRSLHYATLALKRVNLLSGKGESGPEDDLLHASVLIEYGDALSAGGRRKEAKKIFQTCIALTDRLMAQSANTSETLRRRYLAMLRLGDEYYYASEMNPSKTAYHRAYVDAYRLADLHPGDAETLGFLATSLERIADYLYYTGQVDQSCSYVRKALAERRKSARIASDDITVQRALAISLQNAGWCEVQAHRYDQGLQLLSDGIELQRTFLVQDPQNTMYATNLMGGLGEKANTLVEIGRREEAARLYAEAVQIGEHQLAGGVESNSVRYKMALMEQLAAANLLKMHRLDSGLQYLQRSGSRLVALVRKDTTNSDYVRTLAEVDLSTAELYGRKGDVKQSVDLYEKTLALQHRISTESGASIDLQSEALSAYHLALLLKQSGNPVRGRRLLERSRKILQNLRTSGQLTAGTTGIRTLSEIEKTLRKWNSNR